MKKKGFEKEEKGKIARKTLSTAGFEKVVSLPPSEARKKDEKESGKALWALCFIFHLFF